MRRVKKLVQYLPPPPPLLKVEGYLTDLGVDGDEDVTSSSYVDLEAHVANTLPCIRDTRRLEINNPNPVRPYSCEKLAIRDYCQQRRMSTHPHRGSIRLTERVEMRLSLSFAMMQMAVSSTQNSRVTLASRFVTMQIPTMHE